MPNQTNISQPLSQLMSQTQAGKSESVGNVQPRADATVIEIGLLPTIITIVVFLVGLGVAWGTLKTLVSGIKKSIDDKIEPDLKNIRERFSAVEVKVNSMWKDGYAPANSPRQLNSRGNNILEESGIKKIVEDERENLLTIVKKKDIKNAYDAEERIFKIMMNLPKHCPEMVDGLKTGAFNAGVDLDVVLFVGAIHLRNLIFKDLGFEIGDLDKKSDLN